MDDAIKNFEKKILIFPLFKIETIQFFSVKISDNKFINIINDIIIEIKVRYEKEIFKIKFLQQERFRQKKTCNSL